MRRLFLPLALFALTGTLIAQTPPVVQQSEALHSTISWVSSTMEGPKAPMPAVIDFEDLPPGTAVIAQYAAQGVTFNNQRLVSYAQTPGFAHSGTKAIELCFAIEFCSAPLKIDFAGGQAWGRVWVGASFPPQQVLTVIMQAFDQNGAMITQTSAVIAPSAAAVPVQTLLQVTSADANIRQLVVMFAPGPDGQSYNNGLVVDDVEFDTTSGPPACTATAAPTLALTQPSFNSAVNNNQFQLQGNVTSQTPLQQAILRVFSVPNGTTQTSDLLAGGVVQQSGGPFGPTNTNGMLSAGKNLVSVRASNCHGADETGTLVTYAPIADGTRIKLIRMEVVQATQDSVNSVPLVSNKPTVVRVYVRLEGPTTSIANLSGAITATPPASVPIPPLLASSNALTLTAGQPARPLDITSTLNFVLPPEWTNGRTLHFELSKLYIQGLEANLPCDGCHNLDEINAPRYAHFNPTKPVNLVLAPYIYRNGLTPDILFTPMAALQWMNNVYPIRGNFPADGSGIRLLRILPMNSTDKNLCAGCDDGHDFLDDLDDDLWDDLRDQYDGIWPSDFRILAITPCGCGGRGKTPGHAAYADVWNVETGMTVPESSVETYGSYWSHELGHTFGREHAGNDHGEESGGGHDSSFPYPHGGIGILGLAITTEWWNRTPFVIDPGDPVGGEKHAHDFMSYGDLTPDHTHNWVSPYTYQALYNQFAITASAQMATVQGPLEMLTVSGRIMPDGTATFRPFRRMTTRAKSEPASSGPFTVELLDAAGKPRLSHRLNTQRVEGAKFLTFNEFVPWKNGTSKIVLKKDEDVIAERIVSAHTPRLRITSARDGETSGSKDKIRITWQASDEDKDPLTFTVFYRERKGAPWIPVAYDVTGNSATIDTSLLPGSREGRIRVRVTDGVNTAEAETKRGIIVADKVPLAGILSPREGVSLKVGATLVLEGTGYDVEDGVLAGRSLAWRSSLDGNLGSGGRLELNRLSPGSHVITMTVTDKSGKSATTRIVVLIAP